jgi:hypothetical protein
MEDAVVAEKRKIDSWNSFSIVVVEEILASSSSAAVAAAASDDGGDEGYCHECRKMLTSLASSRESWRCLFDHL